MDASAFDSLARSFSSPEHRRAIVRLLAGATLASLAIPGNQEARAGKRKKKVTLCHEGQTITVSRKAKQQHLRHGDMPGACPTPSPPLPPLPAGPTCDDRIRNGAETDIDCGGGTCPRCVNGQACLTRNDCTGARCRDGVCQECLTAMDCPNDVHGECSCEVLAEQPTLKRACVNNTLPHPVKPTCAECPAGTTCVQSAGGVECPKPCGAP